MFLHDKRDVEHHPTGTPHHPTTTPYNLVTRPYPPFPGHGGIHPSIEAGPTPTRSHFPLWTERDVDILTKRDDGHYPAHNIPTPPPLPTQYIHDGRGEGINALLSGIWGHIGTETTAFKPRVEETIGPVWARAEEARSEDITWGV